MIMPCLLSLTYSILALNLNGFMSFCQAIYKFHKPSASTKFGWTIGHLGPFLICIELRINHRLFIYLFIWLQFDLLFERL